jgi:hypothetical protein
VTLFSNQYSTPRPTSAGALILDAAPVIGWEPSGAHTPTSEDGWTDKPYPYTTKGRPQAATAWVVVPASDHAGALDHPDTIAAAEAEYARLQEAWEQDRLRRSGR